MRKKFNLFILFLLIFSFYSNNSIAKPRCEQFYEDVYNQTSYPRDVDLSNVGNNKSIGFILKSSKNDDATEWEVAKDKDGYFKVGKIEQEKFITLDPYNFEGIMVGDVILEVNGDDLRETYDLDLHYTSLADNYELNEPINIKFKRNLPSGESKVFDFNTEITEITFNEPILDIFVNSISPNEKLGSYNISLTTDFTEFTTKEYNLTKIAHQNLIMATGSDLYPTTEQIENNNYEYEECVFDEKRWRNANTRDPNYGVIIKDMIFEDNTKRYAEYLILPYFEKEYDGEKNSIAAQVTYRKSTSYNIKNTFNLKSFPFDKQKIIFKLSNDRYQLDQWKAMPTSWSLISATQFMKDNPISGWNITNFDLEFKAFYDPLYEVYNDGFEMVFEIERKSGYYIFKLILPIILILMVCWSVVWINPKELESRLTITIVCLLSLIAYNFVIDKDLPKLEYFTVLDWIIFVSYIYATIPNFLSIISFRLLSSKKKIKINIELIGKRYGALSYVLVILIIIFSSANLNHNFTNSALSWMSFK
jgi:hypothetical protein